MHLTFSCFRRKRATNEKYKQIFRQKSTRYEHQPFARLKNNQNDDRLKNKRSFLYNFLLKIKHLEE